MRPLEIATAGPYNVTFVLALAIAFTIAWHQGRRSGAARAEWLAVLTLTAVAGLVGARVLHFDPAAATGAKTILGGVMLGALALFAGTRFLRLDPRAPDAIALALPIGFAVGRIGCLLAGCCFGHPTDLPWGAIYDPYSAAFRAQLDAGLIAPDAAASLPVHPTQLYEATLGLFAAAAVPRMRRTLRRPGSVILAVLLTLALGRLILEFFRARDATMFAGMSQVQWLIAAAASVTALLLVARERRRTPGNVVTTTARPTPATLRLACVAIAAPLTLIAGGSMFSPLERLVLVLLAIPPLIALLAPLIRAAAPPHSLATPAALPCALMLIVLQQSSPDSALQSPASAYPRADWSLGFSLGENSDFEERLIATATDDCGFEQRIMERYAVRRRVGGAALSHTTRSAPGRATTIRLRGFAGSERAVPDGIETQTTTRTTLGGIGTSLTFDRPSYALTAGVGGGRFSGDSERGSFLGTLGLRAGPLDDLHMFIGLNDMEPLGQSESSLRLGLGYGFGDAGSIVRAGVWRDLRPFAGLTLVTRGFEIEPSAVLSHDYDLRLSVSRRFPLPPPQ